MWDFYEFDGNISKHTEGSGDKQDDTLRLALVHAFWFHFVLIILTNVLVISGYLFAKRLRSPNNLIIAGLATMDLLTGLITLPLTWTGNIADATYMSKLGITKITCYMWLFGTFIFPTSSLAFLFLMSLDRFLAIKCPFFYQKHSDEKNVFLAMVFMFGITVLEGILTLLFPNRENYWMDGLSPYENAKQCGLDTRIHNIYFEIVVHVITLFKILSSFALILLVLCEALRTKNKGLKLIRHVLKKEDIIAIEDTISDSKITLVLECLYIILWLPWEVTTLYKIYHGETKETIRIMNAISKNCLFMNAWINAVVYALSKQSYRKAYKFFMRNYPWNWPKVNQLFKKKTYSFTPRSTYFNSQAVSRRRSYERKLARAFTNHEAAEVCSTEL